jgi:hypothetical protein
MFYGLNEPTKAMTSERVLQSSDFFKLNQGEPLRTVMAQTPAATVVASSVTSRSF